MKEINELIQIMQTLRDPQNGCPWDKQQTIQSILPYTLEEVYELADAIERDDMDGLNDELGDLLFHIVYYAQMASEQGLFDFRKVAGNISVKLRHRHPHLFSDSQLNTVEEQSLAWEKIKQDERKQRTKSTSLLDEINHAQPAMTRAYALQNRAATVGFDWNETESVLEKIEEEIKELRHEIQSGQSSEKIMAELGDVLFACVNLARHTNINPETALRYTNRKFELRFRYIEQNLTARNQELSDASMEEMEALWQEAKRVVS